MDDHWGLPLKALNLRRPPYGESKFQHWMVNPLVFQPKSLQLSSFLKPKKIEYKLLFMIYQHLVIFLLISWGYYLSASVQTKKHFPTFQWRRCKVATCSRICLRNSINFPVVLDLRGKIKNQLQQIKEKTHPDEKNPIWVLHGSSISTWDRV